ncbi:CPA2 family monovalent cation:H+ antiporter-2 [Halorubrum alkaliphilum]|uniref:CPA2 family monovalent cation:H+ antiporter-2 n=1 Tax=Halorubrum alkaliphilum TaxID=261290 RepID=A0A8T4GDK6_9EURY|nr:cation:proton antiporter [Halorubrum alkaliphilum]MBP1921720.1 CPA2 family monovalent cation:H+ antiporter-2 [Halorubrum alkaliphilum]
MSELIEPLAFVFIVAAVMLLIATRAPVPAVPLYILAGLGIGAGGLIDPGTTLELAQLGIAFLVFAFGVNAEPSRFLSVARDSEHVAAVQVLAVGSLGFVAGLSFGLDPLPAVYFAVAAALSSSLVGRELAEGEIRRNLIHGRLTESIHFVQDLFAVGIILVLGAATFSLDAIALQLGYGVLLFVAAILIRIYVFDLLVRLSGDSDELIMLTGIGLLIGFLAIAEILDLSIVVGAFAAGISITQEFEHNLALLSALESIENFFTAIFFVTLGSLVVAPSVEVLSMAGALMLGIVVVKPLVTIWALIYQGYDPRTAALTSFSLDQISEFALVLAISGLLAGTIPQTLFDAIILAAAATMVTSSITYAYENTFYRVLDRIGLFGSTRQLTRERSSLPDEPLDNHVVVVGYGKLGSSVVSVCRELGKPVIVVENDPDRFELAREFHETCVFGDAMNDDVQALLGIDRAELIVSTAPDRSLSEEILSLSTNADVILRADDTEVAVELVDDGATYVNVTDFLASEQFGHTLSRLLTADSSPESLRQENYRLLRERVSDSGIVGQIGPEELGPNRR